MRGRTRGITAFLAIAFGLAWLPYIPALFGADPFGGLLMPIVAAVACVVVRRWVTREGFADAGLRPNLRHSWRLGLLAAAWPLVATPLAVVIVIAIVIGVGPGGLSLPWGLAAPSAVSILGWLLGSIAGAAWSASVAHAANNLTQLNLTRLAFTGSDGGTLPTSSSVPIILGEAVVLLGVVVLAAGWRWRTAATQLAVGTQ